MSTSSLNAHHRPTSTATATTAPKPAPPSLQRKMLHRIAKASFCTLATVSPGGRPHNAGVSYESVGSDLWIHTLRSSRKGRNIEANPHVGVCIPFRRLPVGPPFTIHFQATGELLAIDDPNVDSLLDAGRLTSISGHGALELADGCFLRLRPHGRVHSFGPGARTLDLIRDPLGSGARVFDLESDT